MITSKLPSIHDSDGDESGESEESSQSSTQATLFTPDDHNHRQAQTSGGDDGDNDCTEGDGNVDEVKKTVHETSLQRQQPEPQLASPLLTLSPSSSSPSKSGTPSPTKRRNLLRTIIVSPKDIEASTSSLSIVDPWVARIRNNDEYLQCGLDFSNGKMEGLRRHQQQEQLQQPQQLFTVVGDLGAQRLSHALLHNTHLLYLNLSYNDIGNDGAVALANCLHAPTTTPISSDPGTTRYESKTSLQSLNLSHNHISSTQASTAFARALTYNTSLRELNLDHNQLTIEGILILLDGLIENATLIRLGLAYNCNCHPVRQHHHYRQRMEEDKEIDDIDNADDGNNIVEQDCTATVAEVVKESIDRDGGDSTIVDSRILTNLLVSKVHSVLRRCATGESALEVLEMHGSRYVSGHQSGEFNNDGCNDCDDCDGVNNDDDDDNGGAEIIYHESNCYNSDNFDALSTEDVRRLSSSMHGIDEDDGGASAPINVFGNFRNHRLRSLTLPIIGYSSTRMDGGERAEAGGDNLLIVHQLRRALHFNRFYHPILQLNDVLNNLSASVMELRRQWVQMKLPIHLKIDNESGALIGLSLSSSEVASLDDVFEYKLMSMVLSYASRQCSLDTVWNIIRFRPDVIFFAGEAVMKTSTSTVVNVECGSRFSARRISGRRMSSSKRCSIS